MTTFEERLRAELRSAAEARPRTTDLAALVDHRLDRRARRTRMQKATFVAVSAAFTLVVGAVALLSPARSHGTTPLAMATPRDGTPGWRVIPEAPISERFQHAAVNLDGEILVFGGYRADSAASGAAVYDPASGRWREAADPPGDMRGAVGVWTGSVVLVMDGGGDLHSYDPQHDRWSTLATSPLATGSNAVTALAWTGEALLAVQNFGDEGSSVARVVGYDPGDDEWTEYGAVPDASVVFGSAVWTGDELIIVGSQPGSGRAYPGLELIAFSPDRGWSEIPTPPLAQPESRILTYAVWTGNELVVGGGLSWSDEAVHLAGALARENRDPTVPEVQVLEPTAARDVAAWNPGKKMWRSLPDAPGPSTGLDRYPELWTGEEVVTWELDPADLYRRTGRLALLDPSTGTWRTSGSPPFGYQQDAPASWTGHEVVVFSGEPTVSDSEPAACCDAAPVGVSFVP